MTNYKAHLIKHIMEQIFIPEPSRAERAVLNLLTHNISLTDFLDLRNQIKINVEYRHILEVIKKYEDFENAK